MNTLAFFGNFSGMELLVILVIGLLLFGSRLPSVGRSLGQGIVEFKKGLNGITDDDRPAVRESAYRAPITDGEDRRVSRADGAERTSAETPRDPVAR
jgi:sec-independent protein translocase protein TatA